MLVARQVGRHELFRLGLDGAELLELDLHACDVLARLRLHELLDVVVERARGHLGEAAHDGLEQRVVDEDVLVLSLHHVVTLRAEAGHVTVHVDRLLVADALQHRVDHDEGASATHARTTRKEGQGWSRVLKGANFGDCLPAVGDHGSGIRRVHRDYSAEELQEGSGVLRNAVVGPGRVLVLLNFASVGESDLRSRNTSVFFCHGIDSFGQRTSLIDSRSDGHALSQSTRRTVDRRNDC